MRVFQLAPPTDAVSRRAATRRRSSTLLLACVWILTATPCHAYDVLLRWSISPGLGIAGYRVYNGPASRTYNPPIDIGRADSSTLSGVVYYLLQNLPLGTADYVAVTAYDSTGIESEYSNEKIFNLTSATPPSVNAGPDQTVTVGTVVSLGSIAIPGISYFWQQMTGPAAPVLNPTASSTQFTPQTLGTYTFSVTAYDAQGLAARDSVTISVTAAPTVTPTATRTWTPTATALSGSANDACAGAQSIAAAPYAGTIVTSSATMSASDPAVGCGNGSRARSVWYRFTAPSSGTLTATTFGSNYDTILAGYTGSCGALAAVPGACNDDTSGAQSRVSFNASAGTTYSFLVSAYNGSGGTLMFQLTFQGASASPTLTAVAPTRTPTPSSTRTFTVSPTPTFSPRQPTATFTATPTVVATPTRSSNDACANASTVAVLPYVDTVVTTTATMAATDPAPGCGNGSRGKSVWYRFTAPTTGTLTVNTFGSTYDTILAGYTGTCETLAPLPGGCNDDSGGLQSRLSFQATAGTTYSFMVTAYSNNGGTLKFGVSY